MDQASVSRVVLRDEVSRDDIDDAMHECGWQLTNIMPPQAHQPGQIIFTTPAADGFFHLVEDGRLGLLYFVGSGEAAEACLTQAREQLSCYLPGEHEQLLADPDQLERYRRGLALMVLTQPTVDRTALERAFAHQDASVRAAALTALTYAPQPQLRPVVEAMRDDDPQAQLRTSAAQVLAALYSGGSS